jgi:hypothetical protein
MYKHVSLHTTGSGYKWEPTTTMATMTMMVTMTTTTMTTMLTRRRRTNDEEQEMRIMSIGTYPHL